MHAVFQFATILKEDHFLSDTVIVSDGEENQLEGDESLVFNNFLPLSSKEASMADSHHLILTCTN